MTNKIIPHGEKSTTIPHGEKKPAKKRKKYDMRKISKREAEIRVEVKKLRSRVRYLQLRYKPLIDADTALLDQAKLDAVKLRQEYYYWVSDQDVIDYCAGMWLCHPTNRMFRLYLSHYGVYTRIQHAMHTPGEWQAIVSKAAWVREFAGWRHPPADGPYNQDSWLARQQKIIEVVNTQGTQAVRLLAA